ncbi:acyltransferase [Planctomonas sp. JC2975]|uniref:acyltransferase family protein n=1 Tax=Planctomonas sp. JC2975 TaxID=2729626 RepID=UPI0014754151|nr:acyltransferase [Planctomonas sp. JC2975]
MADHNVRLRSLDGLRGVAAAIVLLHHLSMTIPSVSNGYDSPANLVPFSLAWWLVATPLKVFVAGPEFVLVFFVLSGFVLALPPLKLRSRPRPAAGATAASKGSQPREDPGAPNASSGYDWWGYYPRRILRLGIPVVASMALACVVITVFPHRSGAGDGSWLARQAHPDTSAHNLWTESLLIVDPSHPSVNPPLWSLTWEMWFSLLLPLVVLLALWSRRMPLASGALLTGISVYGYLAHIEAAQYLPAFALGSLLGANGDRIRAFVERSRDHRAATPVFVAILVSGPLLSICSWLLRPVVHGEGYDLTMAMRVPGALLLVAAVAFWPAAGRIFAARPFAALGAISFSLYLVHSPIVVLFGLDFTGSRWWIGAAFALLTSFALAIGMYLLVERPSRRLAGWAGKRGAAMAAALTRPMDVAADLDAERRLLVAERVLA